MKRLLFALMSAGLLSLSVTSCIDKNYDLSKGIDMTVAVGGDSISLPLINSLKVYLKDLIDTSSVDLISISSKGYSISKKSNVNINVPKVEVPVIEDKTVTPDPFKFSFKDGSTTEITIPGIDKSSTFPLNIGTIDEFQIPAIEHSSTINIVDKLGQFDLKSKSISINSITIQKGELFKNKGLDIPEDLKPFIGTLPDDYSISMKKLGLTDSSLAVSQAEALSFEIEVPEQIESVGAVTFSDGAKLTLTISMISVSEVLEKGDFIPSLAIKTPSFFQFNPSLSQNTITLGTDDAMTPSNGYTLVKTFNLNGLDLQKFKAEDGKINLSDSLAIAGSLIMSNASCFIKKFDKLKDIALKVEAAFNGMTIKSMTFTVPVQETQISSNVDMDFSFDLPEEISSIESIKLQNGSKVNIHIGGEKLADELLNNTKIGLKITLPGIFVMQPDQYLKDSVYTLPEQSIPTSGLDISLGIQSIDLSGIPVPADRKVKLTKNIDFSGKVKVGGTMSSTSIPTDATACFKLSVKSENLKMDDATLTVNSVMEALEPYAAKVDIEEKLDTLIKRVKTANIKDETNLELKFEVPELPQPDSSDIRIVFPKILRFAATENLDTTQNIYTLKGKLPKETVKFQLQRLDINQDLKDGMFSYHDSIVISGKVGMQGGSVSFNDFKKLNGKSVGFAAKLKDIKIDDVTVDLSSIHSETKDTTKVDIDIDMPNEIKAIDTLYLKGTHLDLQIKMENVPALKDMRLKAKIKFPEFFIINDPQVDGDNCWTFTDYLQSGTSTIKESISIDALQLAGKEIVKDFKISEQISYRMDIDIAESSISSKDLKDITVSPVITLANIKLQELVGKVDVNIDETNETFDLGKDLGEIKESGSYLDVTPVIQLNFSTNLGIPIALDAKIATIDATIAADSTEFQLNTIAAATPSDTANSRFWIAEDKDGMPSDYQFIEASHLNKIISSLPDQLKFVITGNTDKSKTHYYETEATYFAKANYNINIPLVFGDSAKIVYKQDIDSLDLGEVAEYITKGIEIYGVMTNSIPLNIAVSLLPVDKDKKELGLDPIVLDVAAGNSDGTPTISNVSAKLMDKNGKLKDIFGFRLSAKITSNKTLGNTQMKPENGLEIMLKVRVPGGMQMDLN